MPYTLHAPSLKPGLSPLCYTPGVLSFLLKYCTPTCLKASQRCSLSPLCPPPTSSCLANIHSSFRSWFKGHFFIKFPWSLRPHQVWSEAFMNPWGFFFNDTFYLQLCMDVVIWSTSLFSTNVQFVLRLIFYSLLHPRHFSQCQERKVYSITNVLNNKCPDNDLLVAEGVQTEVKPPCYTCVWGELQASDQSWLDDF